MVRAQGLPSRVLFAVVCAVSLIALHGGCSGSTDGAAPIVADAGAGATDPVTWCAAYKIINCSCQQCHQNPPLNGAPIPLMTYADTQAPFPNPTSTGTVWQEMQGVVGNRFMPYTADPTVMPPVKPLTDDEQATLLNWLAQGAVDVGGQNCPMTCDWPKAPPPTPN